MWTLARSGLDLMQDQLTILPEREKKWCGILHVNSAISIPRWSSGTRHGYELLAGSSIPISGDLFSSRGKRPLNPTINMYLIARISALSGR